MTKYILAVGMWALLGSSLQAQQVFKGKITYKSSFSGDDKLIQSAKLFLGTSAEIISDGKNFRYSSEGGMRKKEIIFEVGKKIYYKVDAKDQTIRKKFLTSKFNRRRKVTLKKTGKVKVIAGLNAYEVEIYRDEKKQVTVWLSNEYIWNLKDHPYKVKGLLLDGSVKDLDCKVILALEFPHPSGNASITMTAQEIDTNVPKNAFKLPEYQIIDDTVAEEPSSPPVKNDGGKE